MSLVETMNQSMRKNVKITPSKIKFVKFDNEISKRAYMNKEKNIIKTIHYKYMSLGIGLKIELEPEFASKFRFKLNGTMDLRILIANLCSFCSENILVNVLNQDYIFLKQNAVIEKCFFDINDCELKSSPLTKEEKMIFDIQDKNNIYSFTSINIEAFRKTIENKFFLSIEKIYEKGYSISLNYSMQVELHLNKQISIIEDNCIKINEMTLSQRQLELDYKNDILPNIDKIDNVIQCFREGIFNKKENFLQMFGVKIKNSELIKIILNSKKVTRVGSFHDKYKDCYHFIKINDEDIYLYNPKNNTFDVIQKNDIIAENFYFFMFNLFFRKRIPLKYISRDNNEYISTIFEVKFVGDFYTITATYELMQELNIPKCITSLKNEFLMYAKNEKYIYFKHKKDDLKLFRFDAETKEILLWQHNLDEEHINFNDIAQMNYIFEKYKEKTKINFEDYEQCWLFKN
ncbi:hypothetical protein [Fusobacterium necrophorum]|uniref:hypothetical protein n=1 Tax=Fusobacterium necrophorum TaxID=859 RepID=UPI00254CB909|nr:hypothetical protein [Fusobacterium necrophorum]MDK4524992.1 hypothetical protein [Fusobacterium necrophorum]